MASSDFHSVNQFDAYPSVQDNHFYVDPFGFSTTPEVTPTPSIDLTTPRNVTVIKGKTAMLACVVRDVGKAAVILIFFLLLYGLFFEYLHQKRNVVMREMDPLSNLAGLLSHQPLRFTFAAELLSISKAA